MRKESNPNSIAVIGIVWLLIVVSGYYITHNPLTLIGISPIVTNGWSIITVLFFLTIAGGIGKRIIPFDALPDLTAAVLQAGLGFGVISVLTLIIGSFWKINPIIISSIHLFLALLFLRFEYQWIRKIFEGINCVLQNQSKFQSGVLIFVGLIFIIQITQSFAPPLHYDALNYHLTLPKAYLLNEKIENLDWLVMSGMPQTTEMLYLNLMAVAGESAPLLLSCIFGVLTCLALVGYLQEKLDLESAWVAAASLVGGFTMASSLAWGYVDWLGCFFGASTVICLDKFRTIGQHKYVLIAGIFAGLAFSTKYPAGVIFLAGLLVLIWHCWRLRKSLFPVLFQFSIGASIFALPWLIKNLVFTGNPLYPFFFPSGAMDMVRIGVYQGLPPFGNWLDFFFLPLRATFYGVEGTGGYSVSLGPLFLGLGVLAFLNWETGSKEIKSGIENAALISLGGIVVWAIGNRISGFLIQTRFYYALFPAFAILAGYGYYKITHLDVTKVRIRFIAMLLIFIVLLINVMETGMDLVRMNTLQVVSGVQDRQTYLENNLGWYGLVMNQLIGLPESSRVLMLYEPRGFECVMMCDPDEILDNWKVALINNHTDEQILKDWLEKGFTHLLVYNKGIEFLRSDNDPHHPVTELDALENFLKDLPAPIDYGGWYSMYDIAGTSG